MAIPNYSMATVPGCYNTAKLYGERSAFVLANSGHIQSLINPPGNPKAVFWTAPAQVVTAEEWFDHVSKESGSWWPHWVSWVQNRSGEKRPAPAKLGTAEIPPLGEAPGQYVIEK